VIAWAKWYPPYMAARAEQNLKPETPGPLADPQRTALKQQYSGMLEDGIANLNHALALDPHYDDAMAYINLLIRERADLVDSKQQYEAEVAIANDWVQKALAEKKLKAGSAQASGAGGGGGGSRTPERIRVGGNVQEANLVTKVDAVYPPLAAQARISGVVRFSVIINKDGTVQNVQLISGHPLLVPPARDAVGKYVYRPTLLNGEPVEVVTTVDVAFP
jgi:TonB family protein